MRPVVKVRQKGDVCRKSSNGSACGPGAGGRGIAAVLRGPGPGNRAVFARIRQIMNFLCRNFFESITNILRFWELCAKSIAVFKRLCYNNSEFVQPAAVQEGRGPARAVQESGAAPLCRLSVHSNQERSEAAYEKKSVALADRAVPRFVRRRLRAFKAASRAAEGRHDQQAVQ